MLATFCILLCHIPYFLFLQQNIQSFHLSSLEQRQQFSKACDDLFIRIFSWPLSTFLFLIFINVLSPNFLDYHLLLAGPFIHKLYVNILKTRSLNNSEKICFYFSYSSTCGSNLGFLRWVHMIVSLREVSICLGATLCILDG